MKRRVWEKRKWEKGLIEGRKEKRGDEA